MPFRAKLVLGVQGSQISWTEYPTCRHTFSSGDRPLPATISSRPCRTNESESPALRSASSWGCWPAAPKVKSKVRAARLRNPPVLRDALAAMNHKSAKSRKKPSSVSLRRTRGAERHRLTMNGARTWNLQTPYPRIQRSRVNRVGMYSTPISGTACAQKPHQLTA